MCSPTIRPSCGALTSVSEGATGVGKHRGCGSNICQCSVVRIDGALGGMLLFLRLSQGGSRILSSKLCLVKLLLGERIFFRPSKAKDPPPPSFVCSCFFF